VPRISCIIPAYNAAPYLARAVQSLLDCQQPDLEIVIVEDGSRDNTLAMARDLAQQHQLVKVLQHAGGINRGVSATRNLGIEQSTGELLCLLDGDDFVYPHRFQAGLRILQEQPAVDGVYEVTQMVFEDEAAQAGWFKDQLLFGFTEPIAPQDLLRQLLKGRCWATSAILFRRSLLKRTGLFDPRLKIAEDCHLWFRMAAAGTLMPGDLEHPVSAYWRSTGSAYQPAGSRRVEMLQSMYLFLTWLKQQSGLQHRYQEARRAVEDYAINGLIAARSNRQRELAWTIARSTLQMFPAVALNWKFQRQLASLALGR
jgi:hypothetical protein